MKEEKSHSLYYTADFSNGKPNFLNPHSASAAKMRPCSKLKFKFRISSEKRFMDKRYHIILVDKDKHFLSIITADFVTEVNLTLLNSFFLQFHDPTC